MYGVVTLAIDCPHLVCVGTPRKSCYPKIIFCFYVNVRYKTLELSWEGMGHLEHSCVPGQPGQPGQPPGGGGASPNLGGGNRNILLSTAGAWPRSPVTVYTHLTQNWSLSKCRESTPGSHGHHWVNRSRVLVSVTLWLSGQCWWCWHWQQHLQQQTTTI